MNHSSLLILQSYCIRRLSWQSQHNNVAKRTCRGETWSRVTRTLEIDKREQSEKDQNMLLHFPECSRYCPDRSVCSTALAVRKETGGRFKQVHVDTPNHYTDGGRGRCLSESSLARHLCFKLAAVSTVRGSAGKFCWE